MGGAGDIKPFEMPVARWRPRNPASRCNNQLHANGGSSKDNLDLVATRSSGARALLVRMVDRRAGLLDALAALNRINGCCPKPVPDSERRPAPVGFLANLFCLAALVADVTPEEIDAKLSLYAREKHNRFLIYTESNFKIALTQRWFWPLLYLAEPAKR